MVRLSVGNVGALCVGVVLGSETRRVGAAYPGPLFLDGSETCLRILLYLPYLFLRTCPLVLIRIHVDIVMRIY